MAGRFKIRFLLTGFFIVTALINSSAQEDEGNGFSTGAGFCSSFIWRGSQIGTGPHIQPLIEYNKGSVTIGAWGSFDFRGYQETDLYLSFSLPSGFAFGITDYYLSDLEYFDYSKGSGSHAFELNLEYSIENLSLNANYILNEAGGVGSAGRDLYFEAGYAFEKFSLFAGAGNGWHTFNPATGESNFNLCNTGIELSRTIKVSESFEIPVKGQLVFNPDKERLYLVIAFTL